MLDKKSKIIQILIGTGLLLGILIAIIVLGSKSNRENNLTGTQPNGSKTEEEVGEPSKDNILDTHQTNQATKQSDRKIVAYYPSWSSGLDKLRFDIVTHAIYAFAIPTEEGGLRELENPEGAKQMVLKAHKNGAKALIAVGGWSFQDALLEPVFKEATNSDEKIEKFAKAILKLCDDYGFDGVDLDWEYPRIDDGTSEQYESLMLYLAKELHKENKLLTAAVHSGVTPDGTVFYDALAHTDNVLEAVDWLNVMAYDGGDGELHSPYDFAVASGEYWHTTRKLSKEKVVLGVPFYARPSGAPYEEILILDKDAYEKDTFNYYGIEAYYNGTNTIKKKANYAKENFGGIMIWEITQDTIDEEKSLLSAIGEVYN